MSDFLSKPRRDELREAFDLFDSEKTGKLDYRKLRCLLMSIGINAAKSDWDALEAEYNERGNFSWEDLLLIGEQVYNDKVMERALLAGLREISPKGKNEISVKVLRDNLLKLGVSIILAEEEVDMFLKVACDFSNTGMVSFETFIYRVLKE